MVFEKNTLKELLGHSSSKTTEIYTHVSNKLISQVHQRGLQPLCVNIVVVH
jgi:site-specific recombinase XerD